MEKNKLMMTVIIVLLILLLATTGAVSVYIIKHLNSGLAGQPPTTNQTTGLTAEDIDPVPLSSTISTNLLPGPDGAEHVAKIGFSIGVNNTDKKNSPELIKTLTDKENITRDIIVGILHNTTYQELKKPEGQDTLRQKVLEQVRDAFGSNLIVTVYISDWILQ